MENVYTIEKSPIFEEVLARSSIEQAIGNAVPVKMAEYIAQAIAFIAKTK